MATQIVELTGDEARLLKSLDSVIKKQLEYERKLRDTGEAGDAAGIQVGAALEKINREGDQALRGMLAELKRLGPDGQAAASALQGHLTEAGKAGFRSIDSVLDQIALIDPAAAEAAQLAAQSFAAAANSSEAKFKGFIGQFEELGPIGRAVSAELKRRLAEAGDGGEAAVRGIIDELEKLDPESAQAARAIIDNMGQVEDDGGDVFERFSADAIVKIGLIGLAFDKVLDAVRVVNEAIQKQRELGEQARESYLDLAGAQQEALRNFANFSPADRKLILDTVLPEIQQQTRFPSQRELVIAASNLASSGATTIDQIREFTEQAARISVLKPDQVDEVAKGSFLISQATGIGARESVNLLLQAGANTALTDVADIAGSLPNALIAAFATSKVTDENRAQGAAQAAAFFGAGTVFATDETGDSTRTNVGKLLGFLEELTADLPNDPGLPLDRLRLIQQDAQLSAEFLKSLPAEQAFKPSFRKLLDPESEAFQAVASRVPAVEVGTAAVDEFEAGLGDATRALRLAVSNATTQAAEELSQLGPGAGGFGALLSQVRDTADRAFQQNQTTADFIVQGIVQAIPSIVGIDTSIKGGRLEGTTAPEEAVSAILELDVLRRNLRDPAKQENIGLSISALEGLIVGAARDRDLDPLGAQRALERIEGPSEFQPSQAGLAVLQRIADAIEQMVQSNAETAENTRGLTERPDPDSPLAAPALSGLIP